MARGDEVAEAAQAVEGVAPRPERLAHANHFRQGARDERGLGVVAQLESVAQARRDRINILQAGAILGAREIVAGVEAQRRAAHGRLHPVHERTRLRGGQHHGRGQALCHLAGIGRTGESGDVHARKTRRQDLAWAEVRAEFQALDQADDQLHTAHAVQLRLHPLAPVAQRVGGARNEHDFRVEQRRAQIGGDRQFGGQLHARQVVAVLAGQLHRHGMLGTAGDERRALAAPAEVDGHRRAPSPGADDGKLEWAGFRHASRQERRKPGIFSPAHIASKFSRTLTSSNRLPDTSTSAAGGREL